MLSVGFTLTMVLAAANWIDAAEPIIVFQSNRDGDDELFLAMDDGTLKQLTKNKTDDQQPAWSPDGNQIVWLHQIADPGADMDVMVMDVDGNNEVNLTPDFATSMATQPIFSGDGTQIAFSARGPIPNGINNNVVIFDFTKGGPKRPRAYNLTVWGGQGFFPDLDIQDRFQVWSPDSTRIAWQTRRAGNFDIWVTDVTNDQDVQKKCKRTLLRART